MFRKCRALSERVPQCFERRRKRLSSSPTKGLQTFTGGASRPPFAFSVCRSEEGTKGERGERCDRLIDRTPRAMLLGSFFCLLRERRERGAECEVFWGSSCSALRLVSWQACFWQEARGYLHRRRRRSAVRTFGTFLNARLCVHTTLACRGI